MHYLLIMIINLLIYDISAQKIKLILNLKITFKIKFRYKITIVI